MTKLFNFSGRPRLTRIILKSVLISTVITTISSSMIFSNAKVYANGSIGEEEIKKYAQTAIEIEKNRQQTYEKIKKMFPDSDNIPKIVCNDPKSFNSLPANAKKIADNFCKRSQQIVESNGLSVERFNKITEASNKDSIIKQKIYEALLKEQSGSKSP